MIDRPMLEKLFQRHGFDAYTWISARDIVVAQWVRMKCLYGCDHYGKGAACPPNVPSVAGCREFLRDYTHAAVFRFERTVASRDEEEPWLTNLMTRLIELEREVFLHGCEKAFLLFAGHCRSCATCQVTRDQCAKPKQARPTPEALAVDVFATVRRHGLPIEVLSDFGQPMNRYAILLVD